MPIKPKAPCRQPGCPALVDKGYCPAHQKADRKRYDQARGTAAQRGYGSRWAKARASYLLSHPLCVMCEAEGRTTMATVVDHRIPHKGDQAMFWDVNNWQSLCAHHHNSHKQSEERRQK